MVRTRISQHRELGAAMRKLSRASVAFSSPSSWKSAGSPPQFIPRSFSRAFPGSKLTSQTSPAGRSSRQLTRQYVSIETTRNSLKTNNRCTSHSSVSNVGNVLSLFRRLDLRSRKFSRFPHGPQTILSFAHRGFGHATNATFPLLSSQIFLDTSRREKHRATCSKQTMRAPLSRHTKRMSALRLHPARRGSLP